MPLRYGLKSDVPPNRCLECGVQCRRPKRFCSEDHKEFWLTQHKKIAPWELARAREQIAADRKRLGITPQAIEWRQKLALSRPF